MLLSHIIPSSLAPSPSPTKLPFDSNSHHIVSSLFASQKGPSKLPELTCSLDPARSPSSFLLPSRASGPSPQTFSSNTIANISMATALIELTVSPLYSPQSPWPEMIKSGFFQNSQRSLSGTQMTRHNPRPAEPKLWG